VLETPGLLLRLLEVLRPGAMTAEMKVGKGKS
jgi:hypothetical protein